MNPGPRGTGNNKPSSNPGHPQEPVRKSGRDTLGAEQHATPDRTDSRTTPFHSVASTVATFHSDLRKLHGIIFREGSDYDYASSIDASNCNDVCIPLSYSSKLDNSARI